MSLKNYLNNAVTWDDLAACKGLDTELFFDKYEGKIASQVDLICYHCPVRKRCRDEGMVRRESGVWGGLYLESGEIDLERNSHKSTEQLEDFLAD